MKVKGTIRHSEVEGGQWVLEADGGERYQLSGAIDGAKDGMRAEVEGKLDKQTMSFGMAGAMFAVQKITKI